MLQVNTPDMKHHSLWALSLPRETTLVFFLSSEATCPQSHVNKLSNQLQNTTSVVLSKVSLLGYTKRLNNACGHSDCVCVYVYVCVCVSGGGVIIVVFHPDFESNNYHPDITVPVDWA